MDHKNFDINFSLQGKVAIVTGAANGIGKSTALMFLKKGASVVFFDLSADVHKLVSDLNNDNAVSIAGDISNKEDREKCLALTLEKFKKVDILFNNAGITILESVEDVTESAFDKIFSINVKSNFFFAQLVGKQMIKQGNGGSIINTASQAALVALDKHVVYCASKAAVVSMTKVIAFEWGKHKIRTNSISPTVILTDMGEKAWEGEVGEAFKKLIPLKRFGYPEEVAACAVFLASDAASLINGENLVIDGGYTTQ